MNRIKYVSAALICVASVLQISGCSPAPESPRATLMNGIDAQVQLERDSKTPDIRKMEAQLDSVASRVTPQDFERLVERDPNDKFRANALLYFGSRIDPVATLPTLMRIAKNDHSVKVVGCAVEAIQMSVEAGKLDAQKPRIEEFASDLLSAKSVSIGAVHLLGSLHTPDAEKTLHGVVAGEYNDIVKYAAKKALG